MFYLALTWAWEPSIKFFCTGFYTFSDFNGDIPVSTQLQICQKHKDRKLLAPWPIFNQTKSPLWATQGSYICIFCLLNSQKWFAFIEYGTRSLEFSVFLFLADLQLGFSSFFPWTLLEIFLRLKGPEENHATLKMSSTLLAVVFKLFVGEVVFEFVFELFELVVVRPAFDFPDWNFFSLRTRDRLRTAGPVGRENCLLYFDFLWGRFRQVRRSTQLVGQSIIPL